jgi:hypothetical protein
LGEPTKRWQRLLGNVRQVRVRKYSNASRVPAPTRVSGKRVTP